MDIKGALGAIIPIQGNASKKIENSHRAIKSESTADRDANGQQQYSSQDQQHHGPMSDEEFERAIKYLKELPAVRDHSLSLEVQILEGKRYLFLKEPDGKVVRRIAENELWSLAIMKSPDAKKGQLLSKTA